MQTISIVTIWYYTIYLRPPNVAWFLQRNNRLILWRAIVIRGLLIMEAIFSILFVITIIATILLLCVLLVLYNISEGYYSDVLARKDFQKKCPNCGDTWYDRIYRKSWMRLIPGTKHYYCNRCRYKFMIIFYRSALKMSYKRL